MSKFINKYLEDKNTKIGINLNSASCKRTHKVYLVNLFKLVLVLFAVIPMIYAYFLTQDNNKYIKAPTLGEQKMKTILAMEETMGFALGDKNYMKVSNPSLVIRQSKYCNTQEQKNICGAVYNKSNKKIKGLQVNIDLYDEYNKILGTTIAQTDELPPKQKWYFKALAYPYGVENYKITVISGY